MPGEAVLLVEGQDDGHVVRAIKDPTSQLCSFDITVKNGLDVLIKSLPLEIKAPDRRTIGIVVDANDDIKQRW